MHGSDVPTAKTFVKLLWSTMKRKPILHGSRERLRGVRSVKIGTKRWQVDKPPAPHYCAEHRKDTSFRLKLQQNKLIISMTKNLSFVTIDHIKYPVEIVYSCCFSLKRQ